MSEIAQILDQIDRAYSGDAWHGTPLRAILESVTHEDAARRPVPGAHSIWELVLHLITWTEAVRRRASGEAFEPTDEQDWPTPPTQDAANWEKTLRDLDSAHTALKATVAKLSDSDLDNPVPGQNYKNYVMLHGAVQHSLYHAGQIAILRRARNSPGGP